MATKKKNTAQKRKPFATITQTEIGTVIARVAPMQPGFPEDGDYDEIVRFVEANRELWASPEGQAYKRLREILNAACGDRVVNQSEQAGRYAQLIRDLFFMAEPGEPPELFMEPVETLFAGMRSRAGGGGRPIDEVKWGRWRDRYEELKRTKPSLTAQERYEDIAAEYNEEVKPKKPLGWTGIRDGISELKKRQKNRV